MTRVEANLKRTKLSVDVHCSDALEFEPEEGGYDIVLLDAPCSATGTFRRHPDVLYNRSPKDVANLVRLQDKLLARSATYVRPGGQLLYCTCSLQMEEGAPRITKFLQFLPDFRLIPTSSITGLSLPETAFSGGYVRSIPYFFDEKGGMDGFFIALLERKTA